MLVSVYIYTTIVLSMAIYLSVNIYIYDNHHKPLQTT